LDGSADIKDVRESPSPRDSTPEKPRLDANPVTTDGF